MSADTMATDQSPSALTVAVLAGSPLLKVRVTVASAVPRPVMLKPVASAAFTLLSPAMGLTVIPAPETAKDRVPSPTAPFASVAVTVKVSVLVSADVSARVSGSFESSL